MQKRKRGASLHDGGGYGGAQAKNTKKEKKKKNTRRRHEIPTGDYFWKEQEDVLPAFGFPKLLEFEDGSKKAHEIAKTVLKTAELPDWCFLTMVQIVKIKIEKKALKKTKKKPAKDKNAPSRGKSAYMLYAMHRRPELKKEYPNWMFGKLSKAIGEEWREMDKEDKEQYQALADLDKARYDKEMATYVPVPPRARPAGDARDEGNAGEDIAEDAGGATMTTSTLRYHQISYDGKRCNTRLLVTAIAQIMYENGKFFDRFKNAAKQDSAEFMQQNQTIEKAAALAAMAPTFNERGKIFDDE
jgi:hypothetical protein